LVEECVVDLFKAPKRGRDLETGRKYSTWEEVVCNAPRIHTPAAV